MTAGDAARPALAGLRVLDLSRAIAGPYCAQLLSDLGAEVILIEDPTTAVTTRRRGFSPPVRAVDGEMISFSSWWVTHNRNKRSLTLDLRREASREVLLDLIRVSDVVIESFSEEGRRQLGIDYAWAAAVRPEIVWASLTAYGRTGPDAWRGGFDFLAQARAGMMSITGEPAGPPIKSGVSIGDYLGGLHLAIGVLTALYRRRDTGNGQLVDVGLLDATVSCLDGLPMWPPVTGVTPGRIGNFYPTRPPGYSLYRCTDGWLAVGASKGPLWSRLARAIGRPDLDPDPDISDRERWEPFVTAGIEAVSAWCAARTRAAAKRVLDAHDVPNDPLQDMAELWSDAQLQARGMFVEAEFGPLGTVPTTITPIRLSEAPLPERHVLPEPGQDNWDVLTGLLHYSEEKVAALAQSGVLWSY